MTTSHVRQAMMVVGMMVVGFSNGDNFASWEHLAMFRDDFDYHDLGECYY